ncbi:rhodanese-like domain-containing protein [Mycobacterium sp. 050134]|uniref:rhodanese-like domain-containing protein n=1 Tax=Mycobacterium sp. 050134 TaxID=3096111 RepID=UPI002ED7FAC3
MTAPTADVITSTELRELLDSGRKAPRIIDVRTPAEFETAHIAGSDNVPLDVLEKHTADTAARLGHGDVVLVCRSGQRSTKAQTVLRNAGLTGGRVLEGGVLDWEGRGLPLDRGVQRWDLERQVRLVAGSVVLSSVLGSVAVPRLKWVAAGIGGGLTFAALTNTCAMATALSKLPYNRGATSDAGATLARLGEASGAQRAS